VKEAIPPNAAQPTARSVILCCYVDLDHAGDQLTRRLQTGYFQMVNMATIAWFFKMQGLIEGTSFGSEFMTFQTAMEAHKGIMIQLQMMGVLIDSPTYVYCDNMSVVHNTTAPESMH
jgi:hypothetical protein